MEEREDQMEVGKQPVTLHYKDALRRDIQGLRAVSIIFVLLFHLWSFTVTPFGYLGVDVFFVISGHLMAILTERRSPLNRDGASNFYFRRIKRIVPIYSFVIFLTLLVVNKCISPIDYPQIIDETLPAISFSSNLPSARESEYFDVRSKLAFFVHTWSLSVELKFYLLVPMIVFVSHKCSSIQMRLGIFLLMILISFIYQTWSTGDVRHMSLLSRLWQFLVPFAINFCKHDLKLLNANSIRKRHIAILANFVVLLLLYILTYGLFASEQTTRLIVVLLSTFLVANPNGCAILSFEPLVWLGNISYSIYLIHYPVLTWHRYVDMELYKDWQNASTYVAMLLTFSSIAMSYLVEKSFAKLLQNVNSWKSLTLILLIGYMINGLLLIRLQETSVSLDKDHFVPTEEWLVKARLDLERIWINRNRLSNLTYSELIQLNADLIRGSRLFYSCRNKTRSMPTSFVLNMSQYPEHLTYTCHETGNGTKNIVIIGNSHAMHSYTGIRYHFSDLFRTLTLIERDSCFPTPYFQQSYLCPECRAQCVKLLTDIIPALQQWNEPIDILVVFYAFTDTYDLQSQEEAAEHFRQLQFFYSQLDSIPTEVMFVQERTPSFSLNPIHAILSRLQNGQRTHDIGDYRYRMILRVPNLDYQMASLSCSKCIKLNFIDSWCYNEINGFCHSVDPQSGLVFFSDGHHISPLGSLYNGQQMRQLYDSHMTRSTVNKP
ncbi:hypothetical protein M3Y94_00087300 [Aphelenchoides besseyi]|nr:hypothetical protein M3Y94_00087300 [Aphelenchoides besseyi]KAI6237718.1 hypothetical protein M3Y95_00294600 [Aphelenchoides besseyi]